MEFTYSAYKDLIEKIKENNFEITNYFEYKTKKKPCILRHDIDFSLEKALEFAEFECSLNVESTYFILLSTDFYNVASRRSKEMVREIKKLGHNIGLHFDEMAYTNIKVDEKIKKEIEVFSNVIDIDIKCVSMHRPSKETLRANYRFDDIINSYESTFFEKFKYISDSRCYWREDPYRALHEHDKLHILTHPIWYEDVEKEISETIKDFVNCKNKECYAYLKENIRDLEKIMCSSEVLK